MDRKLFSRCRVFPVVTVLALAAGMPIPQCIHAQSQPTAAPAQSESAGPKSFEVASIKPSAEDGRRVMIGIEPGGRYTARGVNVKFLVQQAYGIRDFQIADAPGWMTSERYDIIAKAETPDLDREKVKVLLQSLLAERFNLKFHRETRESPIYHLVVGKNGHKLHKSEIQSVEPPPKEGQPGDPPAPAHSATGALGSARATGAMVRFGRGMVNAEMAPVSELASMLAQQLGRPVVDKTGLEGFFDFKLEWTPDETMRGIGLPGENAGHEGGQPADSSGPTIFSALQEQLGLRLESQKGPVEIIVIDHIDKASEN